MKCKTLSAILSLLMLSLLAVQAQAVVSSTTTPTSTVTQLTDYASSYTEAFSSKDPDISKNGNKVVFVSNADLIPGGNPDNLQNVYVMNSDGTDLRQLTFATIDPTHQNNIPYYTSAPRLSADGSLVVFASTNNLTGENPPELLVDPNYPDYSYYIPNYQIYIINSDGSELKQLTHGSGGDSRFPRIAEDGSFVAFQSNQDLLGHNTDRTEEIYVINADGTKLTQITNGTRKPSGRNVRSDSSRNVAISGDGSTIAFDSFADLLAPKNDDLNNEIFVFDLAGYRRDGANINDLAKYTVQITDVDVDAEFHIRAEDSFEPSLSYDGSRVAFSACINPGGEGILKTDRTVLGNNPFLPDVIFIANRDGSDLRQLTFSDDPNRYADDPNWENIDDDAHWPEISADGSRIVFATRSRVDLVPESTQYEIAMIDLNAPLGADGRPVVEQLTSDRLTVIQLTFGSTDGARLRPSIDANGTKIVFRADSDFTGGNPDKNSEIFKIEPIAPPRPAPVEPTPPAAEPTPPAAEPTPPAEEPSPTPPTAESGSGSGVITAPPAPENSQTPAPEETSGDADADSQNVTAAKDDTKNSGKTGNLTGGTGAFGLGELWLALAAAMFGVGYRRRR